MSPTRRKYLAGTVSLLGTAGLGATVFAQEGPPQIAFAEINEEGEYIVIQNISDEQVDLSGYNVNLEVGQNVDQIPEEPFPEGTTLDPGETLTIATGDQSTVEGDINLGYQGHMINNDEPDTVGILNPDGEIVIQGGNPDHYVPDETPTPEPTKEPTPEQTDTPTEEPTDTPTEEPTEEPTPEPTETPTEGPTDTPTPEPTEEPTETPTPEPTDTPTETPTPEPTDSDGDGLTDSEEAHLGTDPDDTDTDDDGWSDLSEVNRSCDPLDPSSHP